MAWLLTWLVHGLAIALVTRFALRVLPGLSAATRYAMWWAALVLVLILPIVRGLTIDAGTGARAFALAVAVADSLSSPSSSSSQGDVAPVAAAPHSVAAPRLQSFPLPPVALPRVPDWFVSIVIGLWLGSAMLGLAQIAYSVQAVRRLKSSCRRMVMPRESDLPMWSAVRDRGRAARVRASGCVRTAAVLGLTRPIIAVPRTAAAALTPHEIDQVVLHEYAHVQRYDDWTKLLQVMINAFAGWHPAVRLMMREIDFEREAACDDYVVDVTGAPRAYARCLTKVIELMPGSGLDLAAVPHAFSSASHTTTRIERLLDRKRPSGRLAVLPAMAGSVTLAALAFCTVHALPIATDLPHPSEALARGGASIASARADADDRPNDATRDANANANADANILADDDSRTSATESTPRTLDLRISSASTLPIALPFARFSPLSRLTNTGLVASRETPPAATPPAPTGLETSLPAPSTPDNASAASSSSTGLTRADTPPPHADTTLALGPVVAAGSSDAIPEASESGHIGRAWENTRDATSKAMGVSARAVDTATKTAGKVTKTATNKAAAGMKAGGTQTARAFSRVKRTLASVF